jgi:hypothetical protein
MNKIFRNFPKTGSTMRNAFTRSRIKEDADHAGPLELLEHSQTDTVDQVKMLISLSNNLLIVIDQETWDAMVVTSIQSGTSLK